MHFSVRNELDKVVIVGESNNPGLGGGASDAEASFTVFSKKYAFISILWSKFPLKTRF